MNPEKENPFSERVLLTVFIFLILEIFLQAQAIHINEVMTSNSPAITDEDGDFKGWLGNKQTSLLLKT